MSTVTVAELIMQHTSPCAEAVSWAWHYVDPQRAWDECPRGDWLLWLWSREVALVDTPLGRRLVACCCVCACLAEPLLPDGADVLRRSVNVVAAWANASEAQQHAAAWMAGHDAFLHKAADCSAGAAFAHAAGCMLNLRGHAHKVATCAAAARAEARNGISAWPPTHVVWADTLRACADIVRRHHPQAPTLAPRPDPIRTFRLGR